MQRSAFTLMASLWAAQCVAATADPTALEACNGPAFETVLRAAPQLPPSGTKTPQGVWLSRALLQWPDATMTGSFKLYHSASGQLRLQVGQAAAGFDGTVALQPAGGPVPPALATRFKYVKPGAVLQVPAANVPGIAALLQQQVLLRRLRL